MRRAHAGIELLFAKDNSLRKISAEQSQILRLPAAPHGYIHRQHRSKSGDVVVPECALDPRQVGFVQKSSVAGRLQVDAPNFYVERIFLRSNQKVGADGAQLAV